MASSITNYIFGSERWTLNFVIVPVVTEFGPESDSHH